MTLNEPVGPLSRSPIHQNSIGQKSSGTGLNTKKFYGSAIGKGPIDIILSPDIVGHSMLRPNGKVALITGPKNPKITGSLRQRNTRPSELNDPSKYVFTYLDINFEPRRYPTKKKKLLYYDFFCCLLFKILCCFCLFLFFFNFFIILF